MAEAAGEDEEDQPSDDAAEPPGSVAARQGRRVPTRTFRTPRPSAPHPVAPPSSGLAAWLTTPFGDTVTIMCQARDAPLGCWWHLGCLRGEEERNAARGAR